MHAIRARGVRTNKKNMKHLFAAFFATFFAVFALVSHSSAWAHSVDQDYKVVEVLNGSTVRIAAKEGEFTCRLHGIAAPHIDSPFGQASRESLAKMVYQKEVHVHLITRAKRNMIGCRMFIKDKDINLEQVKLGMARQIVQPTADAALLYAENRAKARRLGLWSEPEPVQE